jgi:hypothetical protein
MTDNSESGARTSKTLSDLEAWIASDAGQAYSCTHQYPHPGYACDRNSKCVACLMISAALELRNEPPQVETSAVVANIGWMPWHPQHGWNTEGFTAREEELETLTTGWKWLPVQAVDQAPAAKASEQRTVAEEWENAKAVMSGETPLPPCECTLRDKAPSAYHNAKCPRFVAGKL